MLMKLCICFGICLSSKWFYLTFSFLKPWAYNSSTNQYSYQLFYGWEMTHLVPSYLKNAYCRRGPGETPSVLRCLSYLINSFLTDIKQLAKTSKGGTISSPFWCLCQKLCLSLLYFNKTLLHKKLWAIKPCHWPWIEFLSSRGHES